MFKNKNVKALFLFANTIKLVVLSLYGILQIKVVH